MEPQPALAALGVAEATELGYAWAQRVADAHGIRVLMIKGPALADDGLRAPRVSADVDVLVEPGRYDDYCAAVSAAGWRERPHSIISERMASHSRTFIRDGWPCDLDVHHRFPGFLADPADAFDALWERRRSRAYAHIPCQVHDRLGGILVLGLHSLRSTARQPRHREELAGLEAVDLTPTERAELADLARRTGCTGTLAPVLRRLGVDDTAGDHLHEGQDAALREWWERVDAGGDGAHGWLVLYRNAPRRERPRIVGQAFWPSRHDLLVSRPETVDRPWPRMIARMRRWGRGAAAAPRTLRAAWIHRAHRARRARGARKG